MLGKTNASGGGGTIIEMGTLIVSSSTAQMQIPLSKPNYSCVIIYMTNASQNFAHINSQRYYAGIIFNGASWFGISGHSTSSSYQEAYIDSNLGYITKTESSDSITFTPMSGYGYWAYHSYTNAKYKYVVVY